MIVTPEYNAGFPAPLKNALDFLHAEWPDKALGVVSYGGGGRRRAGRGHAAAGHRRSSAWSPPSTRWRSARRGRQVVDGEFVATVAE